MNHDWNALANQVPKRLDEPWRSRLEWSLRSIPDVDELYRPTSFWQPGVRRILEDLDRHGIENFKRWPAAHYFFYPIYSPTLSNASIEKAVKPLRKAANVADNWVRNRLNASLEVRRDVDVALALATGSDYDLRLDEFGESAVGNPPQHYRPFGSDGPAFGRPYLNYAMIVGAVSRYVDGPLKVVAEIGGGHGALGELLLQRDTSMQYVDFDIPPLATIADYYLEMAVPNVSFVSSTQRDARVELGPGKPSGCHSNWLIASAVGQVDLFVNAFSFQEMEPKVVANYAEQIARLQSRYVVSLNSRRGKPLAASNEVGVTEQVTSSSIVDTFSAVGYEPVARLGRPVAPTQAELVILRRRGD